MRNILLIIHVLSQKLNVYIPFDESSYDLGDIELKSRKDWSDFISRVRSLSLSGVFDIRISKALSSVTTGHVVDKIFYILGLCEKNSISIVFSCDSSYPFLLKQINNYPHILFVKGDLSLLRSKCVSIVGSRKAHVQALVSSYNIGHFLSKHMVTVVSGGAYGCDISSHRGVLSFDSEQAKAIIVVPGSLVNIYPKGNYPVFRLLSKKNALFVSENSCSSKIYPWNFVIRNRIISALSSLTVVMDAHIKSGAMTTAKWALDQGRDVWVYKPADIIPSDGVESLIFEGSPYFQTVNEFSLLLHEYFNQS